MSIVQVNVQGLMMDPYNRAYIVLLRDEAETELLPIWVGSAEAKAIGGVLGGNEPVRPMTHDLMHNVIETLGVRVLSVVINDLRENTFFAKIHLAHGDADVEVDARPSDAIALALRADAPVFVDADVFRKNQSSEVEAWLENLKPGDFDTAPD